MNFIRKHVFLETERDGKRLKILDVGGSEIGHPQATHVIDIQNLEDPMSAKILVKQDICETPWPYEDKEFDIVYCSNTLEDIKDPIRVCKEMERVGKSGVIVVPSPYLECRKGIDSWPGNEKYAGFCHHRWIVFPDPEDGLIFMHKTLMVCGLDFTAKIPEEEIKKKGFLTLAWEGKLSVKEFIYSDWKKQYEKLAEFFGHSPMDEV